MLSLVSEFLPSYNAILENSERHHYCLGLRCFTEYLPNLFLLEVEQLPLPPILVDISISDIYHFNNEFYFCFYATLVHAFEAFDDLLILVLWKSFRIIGLLLPILSNFQVAYPSVNSTGDS